MKSERLEQIIKSLAWAEGNRDRTVYPKVDNGEPPTLTVIERRGNKFYCCTVKENDGLDFSALIDIKEREEDEKELARLQEKLGVKNESAG